MPEKNVFTVDVKGLGEGTDGSTCSLFPCQHEKVYFVFLISASYILSTRLVR